MHSSRLQKIRSLRPTRNEIVQREAVSERSAAASRRPLEKDIFGNAFNFCFDSTVEYHTDQRVLCMKNRNKTFSQFYY